MLTIHWAFSGEHFSLIAAMATPAESIVTRFFCLAISITASAVEEVGKSAIMSTLPWSNHSRARLAAMSGLFWWSAAMSSTGAFRTFPPTSSMAICAATAEPRPVKSE
ncbi:hypothetical protein SAMN05192568_103831 [Methylobacterium pseudosasicola]|uniref:Uncharacterized protein n=1 Tax=Methylobacterium pseudosasicola TaxID=582667 RepID=A0A1I4RWC9_9HYPH|nr:hypothetical protein SAMN05192568_103831 [Methylobacterium pseudosasicola]